MDLRRSLEEFIARQDGILRLQPAWVARDFLPPGRRLGLPAEQYSLGARGGICERWLASTTRADNRVSVPNEGLSLLAHPGLEQVTLKTAVETAGAAILGNAYARRHAGLGRLAKIFDYAERLPYHLHQMQVHARRVGCNSKEEAYYFPEEVPLGKNPTTFFGVHPYIAREQRHEILLPHLEAWEDDRILRHARGFQQVPGDGFHIPAGTLHAPGTALTIELQEDSDVFAMLQARVGEHMISKELLFKDVSAQDRERFGERAVLEMVNWEVSGDPWFYENRHTPPRPVEDSRQAGGAEHWIFYNTTRFSGKRLTVSPGATWTGTDRGVYSLLVWRGEGRVGGQPVAGENPALDELLICYDRAVRPLQIENTGNRDLIIFKFFGPDLNPDIPFLTPYPG